MIKKSKGGAQGPQLAQVDSIERLLEQERFNEAAAKAERLAGQYPDHVRLRDLRIQALAHTGELARAAVLAHEWTLAHPTSKRAWVLVFGLAVDLGLGFLAFHAHETLDALGVLNEVRTVEANERIKATREKYTGLDAEEGLRSDLGLLFLIAERLDDARRELADTTHSVPRTNLAAVMFDQGHAEDAARVGEAAWNLDRFNTHAARIAVRALLFIGESARAQEIGARLKAVTAREPDELAAQIETLNLLEDFDAARSCYAHFDDKRFVGYRRDVVARTLHAGAVAHYQGGDRVKAAVLWRQAVQEDESSRLYQVNLAHADQESSTEPAWVERMLEWFPTVSTRRFEKEFEEAGGAEAIFRDPEVFDAEFDAHSVYLGLMLRMSDPMLRSLVRVALGRRAESGDEDAVRELRRFVTFPMCTDGEKIEALISLYFAHKLPRDGALDVHLRGKPWTLQVNVPRHHVSPMLIDMPEEARQDYVNAVFASEPRSAKVSLGRMERWLQHSTLQVNRLMLQHRIILLMHSLPGDQTAASRRLQAALDTGDALPRTYAFAARAALAEKDIERAEKLLAGQLERAGTSDEDLAPVLLAMRELHAARGEDEQELATWIACEALGAFEAEAA